MEGGKPEYLEKNPRSKDENQQQTQPTYDTRTGNRTRATLVEGECSHHCAIPVPRSSWKEDTEFDCRQECAKLLIPKERPGCYAGIEAFCKICRRHHPSDPQLLFQRLTIVATGGRYEDRKSMFKYEMCTYPPALFHSYLLASQANELALADAIFPIQRPIKQLSPQETSILSLMEVLSCAA